MRKLLIFCVGALLAVSCEGLVEIIDIPSHEVEPRITTSKEADWVGFKTAKLSGQIKNAEFSISVGFFYGTDENNLTDYIQGELSSEGVLAADLNNLFSGKKYFYVAGVKTKKNEYRGDKIYSFITFPEGPIDFGLPSGLKWAACNVGAELPTETGKYYAWGEVETKNYYDWFTYKYCTEDDYSHGLTKYIGPQHQSTKDYIDNKVQLEPEDDAAHVNIGGSWRMPTSMEATELFQNCATIYVTINNVPGIKLISKRDMDEENFIFVPGCGYMGNGTVHESTIPHFWTSTLHDYLWSYEAYRATLLSSSCSVGKATRFYGFPVRPVCE